MPTTPPAITAAPTPYPQRGDRSTFRVRVDAFVSWLIAAPAQLTAVATNAYNNAVEANTSAVTVASLVATANANGLVSAATNAATATTKAAAAAASAESAAAAWTAALAANPDLNPAVRMNPSTISEDVTIPSFYNASSVGPITIGEGVTITIGDDANWNII